MLVGITSVLASLSELLVRVMSESHSDILGRGGARNFPTGGLTLPTRGLKYGFQGIVNAKNFLQNSFSPSDVGASMFRQGAIAPSSPPLAPPLILGHHHIFPSKPLAIRLIDSGGRGNSPNNSLMLYRQVP